MPQLKTDQKRIDDCPFKCLQADDEGDTSSTDFSEKHQSASKCEVSIDDFNFESVLADG